uniref:Granulins domain-containing protein n=1 Tax=Takifugu rubripes TaxID=31033 RepID=A0A674NYL0_TAKRU
MLFHKHQALAALLLSLFVRTLVSSLHRCGQEVCPDEHGCCPDEHGCCPDEHGCCPHGSNSSAVVCCQRLTSKTYYNIAMVTRKLSGVLLLLLLFALGYSLQRLLCSRTGRLAQAQNGHPAVTTSQDPLMESGSPDQGPAAHMLSYHGPKRLPTYEETMRDERAPFTSCLLASRMRGRPRNCSLLSVFSSSPCASSRRSLSELSTTNTTAATSLWKLFQCSRIFPWPPTSHTVRATFFLFFLASSISTLKPMVGEVVTKASCFSL